MATGSEEPQMTLSHRLQSFPQYGAYFLAATWLFFRAISVLAMFVVVGALGYTIGKFDAGGIDPPPLLVKGMVIAIVATIYTIIATFFWYHKANRGLWVMAIIDTAFFALFTYLSTALSEPAVYPECHASAAAYPAAAATTTSANMFAGDLSSKLARRQSSSPLAAFVETNHVSCGAIIAFWAPCVALAVAFFCTAILEPILWYECRKAYPPYGYGRPSEKALGKEEA